MNKCQKCDGRCCKYVIVNLDDPEDNDDWEELKWFLCHENIFVFIDHEDDWCVEFRTPCKFQDPKTNMCTIYDDRTAMCHQHDPENCEVHGAGEHYWKKAFYTKEDIEKYRKEIESKKKSIKK
jgi:Fe-S-cluster containining protein